MAADRKPQLELRYRDATDDDLLKALRAGSDAYQPLAWQIIQAEAASRNLSIPAADVSPAISRSLPPEPEAPLNEEQRAALLRSATNYRYAGGFFAFIGFVVSGATYLLGSDKYLLFWGPVVYGGSLILRADRLAEKARGGRRTPFPFR